MNPGRAQNARLCDARERGALDASSDGMLDVMIGAVFQDEAPYLREWIEYHKMIGVQHFLLVNDRSTDGFLNVLQPYLEAREVELFDWPCPQQLAGRRWIDYQLTVVQALLNQARNRARWLALIDVDEFVVPGTSSNLVEFLRDYEDYGGLYIRWEPFGTSYVRQLAANELVTQRLVRKWKFIPGYDMLGKSLVKPECVLRPNIHRCELLPPFAYFDSNPGMQRAGAPIRINHYWSRDEHFLFNVKLPRTAKIKGWELTDGHVEYFRHLFNDVADCAMHDFGQELRKRVFARTGTA